MMWLQIGKLKCNIQGVDKALRTQIISELRKPGTSLSRLSRETGIHKSQITRFRQGAFTRLSTNLRKVCEKLQISPISATLDQELTIAVHAAWDGTTDSKKRLIVILNALREWDKKTKEFGGS